LAARCSGAPAALEDHALRARLAALAENFIDMTKLKRCP